MTVRVVGPLQWIVYPSLVAMLATIIMATPVKVFGLSLPEPVVPMALAFAWPLIRPSIIGPAALFALGLYLDLLWFAPLGMWGLSLLAVYGVILAMRQLIVGQETAVLFAWFGGCTLFAFLLAYLVMTLAAGLAPSALSLVWQILATLVMFIPAAWMIETFDDGDVRFR